jgi:hypothetical protein
MTKIQNKKSKQKNKKTTASAKILNASATNNKRREPGLGQNYQHSSKHEENSSIFNMSYSTILSGLLCRYLDFSMTPKIWVCLTGQCKAKMTLRVALMLPEGGLQIGRDDYWSTAFL